MTLQVIVGAGPVGSALATLLAEAGDEVRVVTRSGRGPAHPRIERVRADAGDPRSLLAAATGAGTLYNCAGPPSYLDWARDWPPLAAAALATAEATGAALVTTSNLYGYGPVDGPISRDLPLAATGTKGRLRAGLWRDALAAHDAGRVRAAEVRASDYVGPDVGAAHGVIARHGQAALAGSTVWVIGDPDAPHSWTYPADVARTLAAVGHDENAWGQAWHVPSGPPVSVRELTTALTSMAGLPAPRLRRIRRWMLRPAYPFSALLRELDEVLYQHERPFEIDAQATTSAFGLHPTPWQDVLAATLPAWQPDRTARSTGDRSVKG